MIISYSVINIIAIKDQNVGQAHCVYFLTTFKEYVIERYIGPFPAKLRNTFHNVIYNSVEAAISIKGIRTVSSCSKTNNEGK